MKSDTSNRQTSSNRLTELNCYITKLELAEVAGKYTSIELTVAKDDFGLCLTNESVHLQAKNHEDHTTMSLTTVEAQRCDNIS